MSSGSEMDNWKKCGMDMYCSYFKWFVYLGLILKGLFYFVLHNEWILKYSLYAEVQYNC